MPIVIPRDLPAFDSLLHEKIFVMDGSRAVSQDIRPIEIAILNLMPTKEVTETQLLRLLGNTPLQVNVTLVKTSTYKANHTSETYLDKFYKNLDEIKKMSNAGRSRGITIGISLHRPSKPCRSPTSNIGRNFKKSLILRTKTSPAQCLYAGARRRRFITTTA